jgi:CDGSH-type Zn-finger protein
VLSRPDVFVPNVVVETCLGRCGHSQNKPYCDGSHTATENRAA